MSQQITIDTATDPLLELGRRLVAPADRESYADLVLWLNSVPRRDDLVKVAHLLGFLTLIGYELPAALMEQLKQIDGVRERIASLPQQILNGLDPEQFAEKMSERFRQQLAATGLEDSAELLSEATTALRTLAGNIATAVRPLTSQYAGIAETTLRELEKLRVAAARLQQDNENLAAQAREERWIWKIAVCFVLFLTGLLAGLSLEKRSTTDALVDIDSRVDKILQKVTAPLPAVPPVMPQRNKRSAK